VDRHVTRFGGPAMRHRFDQLAKQIGREALSPCGVTVVNDEIVPDAQYADIRHEPDPTRDAERARIGLLGDLARCPCIIEAFAHAPNPDEVRACMSKHLTLWRMRSTGARSGTSTDPFLWILAAGRPDAALAALAATRARGWPRGVYIGPSILRVGVVVAAELPRTRQTLLARLMAGGRGLHGAIEDLAALPEDAPERHVASGPLLSFRNAVANKPRNTAAEREVLVAMDAFKELREEGRREGLQQGLEQGELAGIKRALALVFARRKLTPTRKEAALIDACVDARRLERWLNRAVTADTVAEALAAPRARGSRAH
jgi:hypothetical protein